MQRNDGATYLYYCEEAFHEVGKGELILKEGAKNVVRSEKGELKLIDDSEILSPEEVGELIKEKFAKDIVSYIGPRSRYVYDFSVDFLEAILSKIKAEKEKVEKDNGR